MDALDAIFSRRSVRTFTDEPVTDAEVELLLRAAMAAPSATNEQPWRFVVVRDPETRARLAHATPFAGALAAAPLAVVVCAEVKAARFLRFWVIDCAAAIENMLLAAHASGLGGVWIGVYPIGPFARRVRRVAGLPVGVAAHSLVAVGHPAEVKPGADRFRADFVHAGRW